MSASEDQILEALPMVRRMASRYRRTPLGVEDAVGVGALALVEAGRRYDPGRGVPFAGFAFTRVRGALTDACSAGAGTRRCRPDEECSGIPICSAKSATCDRCVRTGAWTSSRPSPASGAGCGRCS